MPQVALTDRELLKKTLKTAGVMVGATAVWLSGVTLVVMLSTSPPSDKTKSSGSAGGAATPTTGAPPGVGPAALGAIKSPRRPGMLPGAAPTPTAASTATKPGDPI